MRLTVTSVSCHYYIFSVIVMHCSPPRNHKHSVATDDCVFPEPSLEPICSGTSALSSCPVTFYVTRKEEQRKHTTALFTVQFALRDTKSAFTVSQPVRGATQALEIKRTVTKRNSSFPSLQWWKKGERKRHCAPSSPIHWLPLASHSIHTPSWLFILGSRLNRFTNAKKMRDRKLQMGQMNRSIKQRWMSTSQIQ